jgi:hypothetical protein
MSGAALVLFLAAGQQMLFDEVFQIPASKWRYAIIPLKQPPVTVECEYKVLSGKGTVRVALVNSNGLEQLRQGDKEPLSSGTFQSEGRFVRFVSAPDQYAVVLENGSAGSTSVKLRVTLDFSERGRPQARYLSLERRLAVIAISLSVFFGIVFYSAKKLLGAMRN